jgi:hypothetical protein
MRVATDDDTGIISLVMTSTIYAAYLDEPEFEFLFSGHLNESGSEEQKLRSLFRA